MNLIRKTSLLVLGAFLMTIISCKKEKLDETSTPQTGNSEMSVSSESGILVFGSQKALENTLASFDSKNEEQKIEWTRKHGITSQQDIYHRIMDAENEVVDKLIAEGYSLDESLESQGGEFVHSEIYTKYLNKKVTNEVLEEDGSTHLDLALFDGMMAYLVNEDGYIKIGNDIYVFDENGHKVWRNKHISKLDELKLVQNKNTQTDIEFFYPKDAQRNMSSNWSKEDDKKYFGSSTKRIRLKTKGSSSIGGGGSSLYTSHYAEGFAERKVWGTWKLKNDFRPIYSFYATFYYSYAISYSGGPILTKHDIADVYPSYNYGYNKKSPFGYNFPSGIGQTSNYFKFHLAPNGSLTSGSSLSFVSPVNMTSYSYKVTWTGGSNGDELVID